MSTDYNSLMFGIGLGSIVFGTFAGLGVMNYLSKRNIAGIMRSYLECVSKTNTERRTLAQDLYSKGKKDEDVEQILNKLLPIPSSIKEV